MKPDVTEIKKSLFTAFKTDHAILGKGLYDLRLAVVSKKPDDIRRIAEEINLQSGPHIAFEELEFYPVLSSNLSAAEVETMYREHAAGLAMFHDIENASDANLSSTSFHKNCLKQIDMLEQHVSGCGDLFGAMGGLSNETYAHLLGRLNYWNEQAPSWTAVPYLQQSEF